MSLNNCKINTKQVANSVFLPEIIKLINEGHTVTLPLRGFSMRPFLEDGRDKAILKYAENITVGDVVLAELAPGKFVLHRIISIKDTENITLLGDGNTTPEYCRLTDIKGRAIGFYRKGNCRPNFTSGAKWRIYSWWWMRFRPIRRYLLFIYRHIFIK